MKIACWKCGGTGKNYDPSVTAISMCSVCGGTGFLDDAVYQPTTRKNRIVEEVAISKTETISCEWCEKIGKYAQFDFATYTEVDGDEECEYAVKVNFCPNCGRYLKGK